MLRSPGFAGKSAHRSSGTRSICSHSPRPKTTVAHFGLGVVRSMETSLARPIHVVETHPGFRDDSLSLSSLHPGLLSGRPDWGSSLSPVRRCTPSIDFEVPKPRPGSHDAQARRATVVRFTTARCGTPNNQFWAKTFRSNTSTLSSPFRSPSDQPTSRSNNQC